VRAGARLAAGAVLACAWLSSGAAAAQYDPAQEARTARLATAVRAAARLGVSRPTAATLDGVALLVVPHDASLPDLHAADPTDVQRGPHGVWTIRRTIVATRGARLTVAVPGVRELRLLSSGGRNATITAYGADLRFAGARGRPLIVTSWDPARGGPDSDIADGRSSVSSIDGGRLDASWTTFESLGFYQGIASGVAVASSYSQPRGSGDVVESTFRDNFFGAYTYNALGMHWLHDRFLDNTVYGFDPHDNSDHFLVAHDYAAHNGTHGIIFSRFCDHNVIIENVSAHNGWHGIVLDDGKAADGSSTDNIVTGNRVLGNRLVGISLDGSGENLVSRNTIAGGRVGIRVYGPSRGDTLAENRISRASAFGIYLIAPASGTRVLENQIASLATGIRVLRASSSVVLGNTMSAMRAHGIFVDPAPGTSSGSFLYNELSGQGPSPMRVAAVPGSRIRVVDGPNRWQYPIAHRVNHALSAVIGPGIWALLAATVIGGGALVRLLLLGRRPKVPVKVPGSRTRVVDASDRRPDPIAHRVDQALSAAVGPGIWALLAATVIGGGALVSLLLLGRRPKLPLKGA
jgi:parallel beta-helix repeat protein